MIVSAVLAGTFLFGAAYAQTTTTPATKPAEKKEAAAQKTGDNSQSKEKKTRKVKGHKHAAKKADNAAQTEKK